MKLLYLFMNLLFIQSTYGQLDLSATRSYLEKEEIELQKAISEARKDTPSPLIIQTLLDSKLNSSDRALIAEWYKKEKSLHERYDRYQNLKLDYFAQFIRSQSECLKDHFISLKQSKHREEGRVLLAYNQLFDMSNDYYAKRALFATKDDYMRVIAYNKMFKAQLAFADQLEKEINIHEHRIWSGLHDLAQKLTLLPNQVDILYNLRFKQISPQGETPIIDAMGRAIRKIGRQEKVEVTWKGLENIPAPVYDGKTLNIIAFEHANSLLDTIAQAEIPAQYRQGLGFYGAAKYVFPAAWVRALEKSDHYIVVNQGKEIPRTLEILGNKKLHGFFASAEGLTPAGLMETRPISPLFTDTYWALRDLGLEVSVTPMSYPKNFRLYNDWLLNSHEVKKVVGVVRPKLSSQGASRLADITGDRNSLGIWLRSSWHETLDNEKTLLASPLMPEMVDMLYQKLWSKIDQKMGNLCQLKF